MLPIAMGDDGLPPSNFGLVISLNGILIVLGQLCVPRLIRGRSKPRILALSMVIMAVVGLAAFAHSASLYAVTVLVWTVGEMIQSPSTSTTIAELSPAELRGRYQGVQSLSWSVAASVAPVLGGLVRQHLGNTTLWVGVAVWRSSVRWATWSRGRPANAGRRPCARLPSTCRPRAPATWIRA
jgi:MFS family permease